MNRRQFRRAAAAVVGAFSLGAAPVDARVLHVDFTLVCPDPTVCSCPDATGACFRFLTITDAMAAAVSGDSILVRGGVYSESVSLKDGVHLLGGWDGTFTNRDPSSVLTMIFGSGTAPAVESGPTVGATALVDGFTLTGGGGSPGAGVVITGGSPVFRNNRIVDNVLSGIAGGVYIREGSTARLENNVITGNSTQGSGGGVRSDFSSPVLVGNLIEQNTSRHSGGGFCAIGGAPACSLNTIRDNVAGDGGGGGAYLQHCLTGTQFVGNDIVDNSGPYGGGVMMKDESSVTFVDNDFTSNVALNAGGGIAAFGFSEMTLTGNRFVDCVAQTSYGGGVYALESNADVTGSDPTSGVPDASFVNCTSAINGGGFYALNSTGVLSGLRVQNCEADSAGGGIFVARSLYTITENLIVDCTAQDAGGLAILFNNQQNEIVTQCLVFSNTIYGCTATNPTDSGGGITLFANGQANIAHLAGNIVAFTRQGSALRCKRAPPGPTQTARPTVNCSTTHLDPSNPTPPSDTVSGVNCVDAYTSDSSNRIGDPLFCSAISGNFALQDCSPDVNSSCEPAGTAGDNRGVPYAGECACGLTSLRPESWGKIKASYR
jgi:hypothetical protein